MANTAAGHLPLIAWSLLTNAIGGVNLLSEVGSLHSMKTGPLLVPLEASTGRCCRSAFCFKLCLVSCS